jgi:hypothetical protein
MVKWTPDQFLAKLNKGMDAAATGAARVLADEYRRGMGRDHGGKPSAPGGFPNSQTGDLRRSFNFTAASGGVAYAGSNNKVAKWLNFGVTIRPKGKRLAIPLNNRARLLSRQNGGSARAAIAALKARFPKRFVMLTRNGSYSTLIGVKPSARAAKGTGVEGWYLLTNKPVRILPRPWAKWGIALGRKAMQAEAVAAFKAVMK